MRLDDWNGASSIVENQLLRCNDQGNCPDVWRLRLVRADILRLRGHTEEALRYLNFSEALYPPQLGDSFTIASLKKSRGYLLGHLGQYASSHALMQEAERLARDAGLLELRSEVYECQAMIYYLQEDYTASDRIFRMILANAEETEDWYFQASALWGIGKNLMIQRQYHSAIPWLQDSLKLFETAGARLSVAIVWSEMAVCHLGLGDDQTSLKLLQNALEVNRAAGNVHNYLVVLANIGNVYLHRGDHLRAIAYYRDALALAREIKDPVSIQKWSLNIRLAYARLRESVEKMDKTS